MGQPWDHGEAARLPEMQERELGQAKKIRKEIVMAKIKSQSGQRNLYGSLSDLGNEATVEQFFVNRLLPDLGYADNQIKPKTSLQSLTVHSGRRAGKYKPDYALEVAGKIRWVIDAKATGENLDEFVGQCASYCLNINQRYENENPVRYFMITNGVTTRVYEWDRHDFLVELQHGDFSPENEKYRQIRDLLRSERFSGESDVLPEGPIHKLRRENIDRVNAEFSWCHQFIHKKDDISQASAFMEFVKVVFLKLLSDRDIHDKHPEFADSEEILLPAAEVRFSMKWIEAREGDHPNPLDALQFQSLLQRLEEKIQTGHKKRIFKVGEKIDLKPTTIKRVVERLEGIDLFGIDADLNGRLFETFLSATMRGKDLGQYFTPRSVVKLAVKMAMLSVGRNHVDKVIDACCGTGGFLIDALADMTQKLKDNGSLTRAERDRLQHIIETDRIFGVDIARDPALACIARMNMYLHGDGGSGIYQADALDKSLSETTTESAELKKEKEELRNKMGEGEFADVILTNPPFAKVYQRKDPIDVTILDRYHLAFSHEGGQRRPLPSLKSSVMFIERYYDLLKPGGRMITVIDDSILGSDSYADAREFIRAKFIVRAVISLPGDAFQRSKARVKTSLLYLEKKNNDDDLQPDLFMYYCTAVGIDDSPRQRVLAIDAQNREKASKEISEACKLYAAFLNGESSSKKWMVPASAITDRMDVKSCLPKPARLVKSWKDNGIVVVSLKDIMTVVDFDDMPEADVVDTENDAENVIFLRVQYNGFPERGDEVSSADTNYKTLYRVHENDIVISHINAVHGAVAVIPHDLDGLVVSHEYTICRANEGYDPRLLWSLLRSPEMRSDLLLLASGIGRHRVQWANAAKLQIPLPSDDVKASVVELICSAEEQEASAMKARETAQKMLEDALGLGTEKALQLLAAFKPPK